MNAQTELSAVAQKYFDIATTKDSKTVLDRIPISKIHGIAVDISFEASPRAEWVYFKIYAMNIDNYNTNLYSKIMHKVSNHTVKDVENFITEQFDFMRDCVFDRMTGKFVLPTEKEPTLCRFIAEFAKDKEHITSTVQECCVCYELTKTRTRCNHYVCVECWNNLNYVDNEEEQAEQPCPMCKTDLSVEEDDEE
jgi:hypothetical protein